MYLKINRKNVCVAFGATQAALASFLVSGSVITSLNFCFHIE
jgi:hypothetical protein